jgi:hypothetical protein
MDIEGLGSQFTSGLKIWKAYSALEGAEEVDDWAEEVLDEELTIDAAEC